MFLESDRNIQGEATDGISSDSHCALWLLYHGSSYEVCVPEHSESKRSFLRLMTLLLGACAALLGSWGAVRFALFGGASSIPREFPASTLESLQDGVPMHVPDAGAWLIKRSSADIAALDDRCTHLGCRYRWEAERHLFACPCHGSEFASDGSVLKGPATRPLTALSLSSEEQGKIRLVEGKG